jgi:hypothetical protein
MIRILLTRAHSYTIQHYLESWGRDVRNCVKTLCYEDLAFGHHLKPGTYIFADLERLDEAQLDFAKHIWRTLAARPESYRLLNDPSKVLRRYELLKALHANGTNTFEAYRLNNGRLPQKFPLFLRRESEHDGAISPLLNSREEMDRAVDELTSKGVPRGDLLAVEYCETGDAEGVYRKYSAFRVGDRLLARHALFSRKWVVKLADETHDQWVEEERQYLQAHPHAEELRKVYELANIDYGRVDYSLLNGKIQVWEINTNPNITSAPMHIAPGRLPTQWAFIKQLGEAFEAADLKVTGEPTYVRADGLLARRLNITPTRRIKHLAARGVKWLARRSFVTENQ